MIDEMMFKLKYGSLERGLLKICLVLNEPDIKVERPSNVKIITTHNKFSIYENEPGGFDVFVYDNPNLMLKKPRIYSLPNVDETINYIRNIILEYQTKYPR